MYKSNSVLEYQTYEILWDVEMQTDHLITTRRKDMVLINKKKKTCHLVDFADSKTTYKSAEEDLL